MANSLVLDCPHCAAQQVAFTLRSEYAMPDLPRERVVTASCNSCHLPVVVRMHNRSSQVWNAGDTQGNLMKHASLVVLTQWPKADVLEAPADVPEKIARTYVEAAEARRRRSWNAACGMYRRAMELALKAFAPEVEAWKLEKRIDKLANEHRITRDIQQWAHELRLDGNEALHGDEDATEEMTEQMHHLTHFLLVYLYTLPKQIEDARERRDAPAE
ncbi:DUF4145 domain-containing protein [Variovorax paradoxus]|uniref:DUF4145 domain-containing protein n=1 Tax=Variovorax paradoxus TaxID=34073 RepID=UPI00285E2F46|nr:DUF4145 domain-containing protein [Variovorax paradoxus]MDR6453925.1 hypothetical protein [Variovorax paradoxus]